MNLEEAKEILLKHRGYKKRFENDVTKAIDVVLNEIDNLFYFNKKKNFYCQNNDNCKNQCITCFNKSV